MKRLLIVALLLLAGISPAQELLSPFLTMDCGRVEAASGTQEWSDPYSPAVLYTFANYPMRYPVYTSALKTDDFSVDAVTNVAGSGPQMMLTRVVTNTFYRSASDTAYTGWSTNAPAVGLGGAFRCNGAENMGFYQSYHKSMAVASLAKITNMTLATWINVQSFNGANATPISRWSATQTGQYSPGQSPATYMTIHQTTHVPYAAYGNSELGAYESIQYAVGDGPIPTNAWVHLAWIMRDGGTLELYTNGILSASSNVTTKLPWPTGLADARGRIGFAGGSHYRMCHDNFALNFYPVGEPGATADFFVDEQLIYDFALTSNEVYQLATAGTVPDNYIWYQPYEEEPLTYIPDQSGNGNIAFDNVGRVSWPLQYHVRGEQFCPWYRDPVLYGGLTDTNSLFVQGYAKPIRQHYWSRGPSYKDIHTYVWSTNFVGYTNLSTGSMSMWIQPSVTAGYTGWIMMLIGSDHVATNSYFGIAYYPAYNPIRVDFVMVINNVTVWRCKDSACLRPGYWEFLTITHDGTYLHVYVNGVEHSRIYDVSTDTTVWLADLFNATVKPEVLSVMDYAYMDTSIQRPTTSDSYYPPQETRWSRFAIYPSILTTNQQIIIKDNSNPRANLETLEGVWYE